MSGGAAPRPLPDDVASVLEEARRAAHGMLRPEVYAALYRAARAAAPGNAVEIGAAHGAATIALALGLRDGGGGRLYSFEKVSGGSILRYYADEAEAEAALRGNLRAFGVGDLVTLVMADVEEGHRSILDAAPFALLLVDADGALDRDFRCLYNHLEPGATIIVDDCEDRVKVKRTGLRRLRIDMKHKLTHHLVEHFLREGLLEEEGRLHGNFFGRKPAHREGDVDFADHDFASVYRRLVFTRGRAPSLARMAYDWVDRRYPVVGEWIREARRRLA